MSIGVQNIGDMVMARIKIEQVIDSLSSEMKKALKESVEKVLPGANVDSSALFKEFRRTVGRKCNTWERVPDIYVEKD